MTKQTAQIDPIGKPRMTQRDRWKKRPCVIRYHEFCDRFRAQISSLPERYHARFHIRMPKSWSKKKKGEMMGKPHQQKPDTDNLVKAIQDAVCDDDAFIWDVRATKVWSESGLIEIEPIDETATGHS